jgi:hypothetical protein
MIILNKKSILTALQKTTEDYDDKLKGGTATEKVMFSLIWDIEELKRLNEKGRMLRTEIMIALDVLCMTEVGRREHNLQQKLGLIRTGMRDFLQGMYRYKRIPATHMFVFMISSSLRDRKPCALPCQCLPYASLRESDMRRLVNNIVKEMVSLGMKVAGFVSNGQFNYLRNKGYSRPLSVLHIRADVRSKYSRKKKSELLDMLSPKVLREMQQWTAQGFSFEDVIDRIRLRTVRPGYVPHPWHPGKTEGLTEKLHSILAQFEYQHCISQWAERGVDFKTYLYVAEVHPETDGVFYEREDEAHVCKTLFSYRNKCGYERIANHTRAGGPSQLNLEHYIEAVNDPSSGLTYPALTGQRKQSVTDAERLFNPDLAKFMREKGYEYEAKYIEAVWGWRQACDCRGLTELQRCRLNYQFLNLILDELMPWHREFYDFSLLEVNRPINNILGFSRETVVALTTNIEGRESGRHMNKLGKAENPRSSTTDDVECFFSMMRDAIGQNFTTKQVQFGFRNEFEKRLDPHLPFYYHTSSHTRYSEGPLPDFNLPSKRQKRKNKRLPRREVPTAFSVRRATLPVHASLSVRAEFHNRPVDLPPPPTDSITSFEHSYA